MAARTTFPKKDGKICALVPQKARACAVTSLEININSRSRRKMLYISCKNHQRLELRMAAHYEKNQKEPYFNNEESPD